jgi:hypothetical protein
VSPNGQWYVYGVTGYKLRLVDLSSGRASDIATGLEPEFSPDGRYLAFFGGLNLDKATLFDVRTGRVAVVGGRGRFLSGRLEWAHKSDRLVGLLEGGKVGQDGVVDPAHPRRILLVPILEAPSASWSSWAWDDRGLIYWTFGPKRVRLVELDLHGGRAKRLASFPEPACGQTCDWNTPPLAVKGGVIYAQGYETTGAFGFLAHARVQRVRVAHLGYAGVGASSVDNSGRRVLMSWVGFRRSGIALWTVGHSTARRVGPGLSAWWVTIPGHR